MMYSGVKLSCELHACKRRCHPVVDHTKIECTERVKKTCDRQHETRIPCFKSKSTCHKCIDEDRETERRVKRDLDLERRRAARQAVYAKDLQEIQDEIEHERRTMKYAAEDETQKAQLAQQRQELASLKETVKRHQAMKKAKQARDLSSAETEKRLHSQQKNEKSKETSSNDAVDILDSAQGQWDYLKQFEGATSKPLDELIGMIGLENVKLKFLEIKATVDTKVRENIYEMNHQKSLCT
jgi:hypothetical protein